MDRHTITSQYGHRHDTLVTSCQHVTMISSVCRRCRKRFTSSEDGLCGQCDECCNEVYDLSGECRFKEPRGSPFFVSVFMLFENDFVLAKVLPIDTVLNNTTTAITKANVVRALYLSAMLLTYWFSSPKVSFTSSISKILHNTC